MREICFRWLVLFTVLICLGWLVAGPAMSARAVASDQPLEKTIEEKDAMAAIPKPEGESEPKKSKKEVPENSEQMAIIPGGEKLKPLQLPRKKEPPAKEYMAIIPGSD